MRGFLVLAVALSLASLGGCSALNHFDQFREGMDAGPRPDGGQDAFEMPDAGAPDAALDAPSEPVDATSDSPSDAPVDAPSDAPVDAPVNDANVDAR